MPIPVVDNVRIDVAKIQELLGGDLIKVKESNGDTHVCIATARILDVLSFLKSNEDLAYDYFCECLGVDYSTWTHERDLTGRFEIVYNLYSLKYSSRLFVKIGVEDGVTVPTAKHIYAGAEYPEREIQDLYGVIFEGNGPIPGQRFLLPDDWVGFPLRKEYPLGGEDVLFDGGTRGPAVEDKSKPHAGESFEGRTGSEDVSGR